MRNKELIPPIAIICAVTLVGTAVAMIFNIWAGFVVLFVGLLSLFVFIAYTKKRYQKIEELNDYLSQVVHGNYSMNVPENEEGELSILSNNLFKVVSQMQTMNEKILSDKESLAVSLADISHQLKTPLTAMCVSTDILKSQLEDEGQQKFIGIIENETSKMTWLITTLLKLSKLDAGTTAMNFEINSLESVVRESLSSFMIALDLKEITLEENIKDVQLICDKNWLIEAVRNIIKNSIEHTPDGGTLSISTNATTLYNEIVIRDNGCGIDEDDLPHIFERFYKSKNAKGDSVGIGLALAKEIVLKHKGKIEVESEAGKGTSFSIKLYKVTVIKKPERAF